jgi:hypothetical protein
LNSEWMPRLALLLEPVCHLTDDKLSAPPPSRFVT